MMLLLLILGLSIVYAVAYRSGFKHGKMKAEMDYRIKELYKVIAESEAISKGEKNHEQTRTAPNEDAEV